MYYRIKELCTKSVIKASLYYDARSEKHKKKTFLILSSYYITLKKTDPNKVNTVPANMCVRVCVCVCDSATQ
jgi:hypothetical protein